MADFTVRVEMHGANSEDYEDLHESMKAQGYSRDILGDTGQWFEMPTAEYNCSKNLTAEQIRDEVMVISSAVKTNPSVLVSQSSSRAWNLVKK